MNKKLLALAVAAAMAPAAAMADTGNVTIYGVLDASYNRVDNDQSAAGVDGTSTNQIVSNNSRLGFKGTEDMGNGLSAVWQIENTINVDGGATSFASRNTFLGLSGKTWGTVILGKHDTPYKLATRSLDLFQDGVADNRNLMGGASSVGAVATFDGRQNDVVAYISPDFAGFHAAIAYVAGAENATTSGVDKGDAWSAMGMYKNGPWMGSLAYERHNFGSAGTGSLGAVANKEEHAWKLGVGYSVAAFDLGLVYEKTSDDVRGTALCGVAGATGTGDCYGHNAWHLTGAYKFGNNAVKLAYTRADDLEAADNTGANQWSVGIDHNFSKRTKIYALYTRLNNDDNVAYTIGSVTSNRVNLPGTGLGADPSAFSLGVRHSF